MEVLEVIDILTSRFDSLSNQRVLGLPVFGVSTTLKHSLPSTVSTPTVSAVLNRSRQFRSALNLALRRLSAFSAPSLSRGPCMAELAQAASPLDPSCILPMPSMAISKYCLSGWAE